MKFYISFCLEFIQKVMKDPKVGRSLERSKDEKKPLYPT